MFRRLALLSLALAGTPSLAAQIVPSGIDSLRWDQATILPGFLHTPVEATYALPVKGVHGDFVELSTWRANAGRAKGLWIVLPGTGSNGKDVMGNYFAESLARTGYDSVLLPNPFSDIFQSNFSRDGLVGMPQHDNADLLALVAHAYSAYVERFGAPPRVQVIGLSLGATFTLLLSHQESELGFRPDRYVAVNPPVDFQYALDFIDGMIHEGQQSSASDYARQASEALPLYLNGFRDDVVLDADGLGTLHDLLPGEQTLHREMLGEIFGHYLSGITSHLPPAEEPNEESQLGTLGGYEAYLTSKLAGSTEVRGRSAQSLAKEVHLRALLSGSPRLADTFVITAADDFLLGPGDAASLDPLLPNRLFVFSSGGHCGEMWVPAFHAILRQLSP